MSEGNFNSEFQVRYHISVFTFKTLIKLRCSCYQKSEENWKKITNKRRSRIATFCVKGAQKWRNDWSSIQQMNFTKSPFLTKEILVVGDLDRRIQASSFRDLWVRILTKYWLNFFAILAYRASNLRTKFRYCSIQESYISITASIQTLLEQFRAVVSEKDVLEHRKKSTLTAHFTTFVVSGFRF